MLEPQPAHHCCHCVVGVGSSTSTAQHAAAPGYWGHGLGWGYAPPPLRLRRRPRSRFLRPRRMVEKQCTFWLYTKCSIYVHCTLYLYIYGCYMVHMYGSGWVKNRRIWSACRALWRTLQGSLFSVLLFFSKVEKILKGSWDSIPSPSPSVKIQIIGGRVYMKY